jgi:hypothetical protein
MLPSHGVYSASSPASFANCNCKEAITTPAQPAADTQSLRQTLDALFLDATPNYSRVFWTTLQITRIRVPDPGARFENLVASHLLKWVHFQIDTRGRELELRYFRDIDGREVDFVVTETCHPRAPQ